MKLGFYFAFSAAGNFGDWWLYEVIKRDLPDVKLIPFSRVIRQNRVRKVIYRAWERKIFPSPPIALLGGGTILIPGIADFIAPMLALKSKKYTLGSGAKSIEECERFYSIDASRRDHLVNFYSQMEALTVRGPISKASLEALGVEREVRIVGDPFLSLFNPQTEFRPWEQKKVLLNVANLQASQSHHWLPPQGSETELYVQIVEQLKKCDYKVEIFYCAPEDKEISLNIAAKYNLVVTEALTPLEMNQVIKQGDAVIATRLHAMIYSIISGIPTATLIYQDKHLDFLNSIGWTENLVRLCDLRTETMVENFENMWQQTADNWPTMVQRITSLNQLRQELYHEISTGLITSYQNTE